LDTSTGERVPQKVSVQHAGSFTSKQGINVQGINVLSGPILPVLKSVLSEVAVLPVSSNIFWN